MVDKDQNGSLFPFLVAVIILNSVLMPLHHVERLVERQRYLSEIWHRRFLLRFVVLLQ